MTHYWGKLKTCNKCGKKEDPEKPFRYGQCRACINAQTRDYERRNPWARTLKGISGRCTWKGNAYYKKGITYKINTAELKELWYRDGADKMKRPSIDRINEKEGYSKDNCRYMELGDNIRRGIKDPNKWAIKYDKCIECGTIERRHAAHGLCVNCFNRGR